MVFAANTRKVMLTLHVGASVGWMGALACFLALAAAGVFSAHSQAAAASYLAMDAICWAVLVPLSLASPMTGVLQALGTPWGLARHYWVFIKFLITLACTGILLLHMLPTSALAAAAAQGQLSTQNFQELRTQLLADAVVALVALALTLVLSIYKPKGLTLRGMHWQQGVQPSMAAHRPPSWVTWLKRLVIAAVLGFLAAHLAGKGLGGHGRDLHQTNAGVAAWQSART